MGRLARMMAAGAVVAAVVVGLGAAPASAHVTINTLGTVAQGSFAKLGFSVPNERDDAGTVMVQVQLPEDHPLAYVSVQPMPGWDIETTTRTLDEPLDGEGGSITEVVDTITWTATGDTVIAPGQFELFWISAGQMPDDVTELAFPALQTYSSGEEVAWIDTAAEDGAEPEHPAPTVQLVAADTEAAAAAPDDDDGGTDTLSIIALVVGALGLAVGATALVSTRLAPDRPPDASYPGAAMAPALVSSSDHPPTWKFDLPIFHAEDRAQWRAWLVAHHDSERGVWLCSWRSATGRPLCPYPEAVEEALCFGWIDSTVNVLDDDRALQLMTPRKAKSTWTRLNRQRVAAMEEAGSMTDAGRRAVAVAQANGSWTVYDPVEDLVEPPELAAALDADPAARRHWDGFPPSARKQMLWWVISAAKDETRRRRVMAIVEQAATGRRAQG